MHDIVYRSMLLLQIGLFYVKLNSPFLSYPYNYSQPPENQLPEIPVEEEEWYFGDIDQQIAESKCKKPGDYLVRYSERQDKYVLTCNWNGAAKHFVIQQILNVSTPYFYKPHPLIVSMPISPSPDCAHLQCTRLISPT